MRVQAATSRPLDRASGTAGRMAEALEAIGELEVQLRSMASRAALP